MGTGYPRKKHDLDGRTLQLKQSEEGEQLRVVCQQLGKKSSHPKWGSEWPITAPATMGYTHDIDLINKDVIEEVGVCNGVEENNLSVRSGNFETGWEKK